MIEQSPSLPLAFSAARTAFSSSLNNCEEMRRIYREQDSKNKRTHPPFTTFLHGFQAAPSLSLYPAIVWNVEYEYRKKAGDNTKQDGIGA